MASFFGFMASIISTCSLLPQIIETYRSKSAEDVSLFMLISFILAAIFWIAYGIMTGAKAVLWTNISYLISSVLMLYMKTYYHRQKKKK